jgi:hypothetical protein
LFYIVLEKLAVIRIHFIMGFQTGRTRGKEDDGKGDSGNKFLVIIGDFCGNFGLKIEVKSIMGGCKARVWGRILFGGRISGWEALSCILIVNICFLIPN